jgi:hypothetical protein
VTILRAFAGWAAWTARGLVASVLVGTVVGLTNSALLHSSLWIVWVIGGAVALPMRQLAARTVRPLAIWYRLRRGTGCG